MRPPKRLLLPSQPTPAYEYAVLVSCHRWSMHKDPRRHVRHFVTWGYSAATQRILFPDLALIFSTSTALTAYNCLAEASGPSRLSPTTYAHTKTQPRTQDAHAQTVEKQQRQSEVSTGSQEDLRSPKLSRGACEARAAAPGAIRRPQVPMYMPPEPIVLPSVALGLLITFRTNTANMRYNEARCLWGEIVNTSRDITRIALQWMPQSKDDAFGKAQAAKVCRMTKAFSIVLKYHLTIDGGSPDGTRLEVERDDLIKGEGGPILKKELRDELIKCLPPSSSCDHPCPTAALARCPSAAPTPKIPLPCQVLL